jgi:uncharacterized OsmC-like protein
MSAREEPMGVQSIREALARAGAVFAARPMQAVSSDTPAKARWLGGLECELSGSLDARVRTAMPRSLGGRADAPTPGWYLRAAQASCLATVIALRAAETGLALRELEVEFGSESDARGVLGLPAARAVGPLRAMVRVRISADNVAERTLRELVQWAFEHSPVAACMQDEPRLEWKLVLSGCPA